MVTTVKLRKQGGSLAVTLPKEVVRELGVRAGGAVHLVQGGPGEFRLTPHDPEFRRAMAGYERGAAKDRPGLRELAQEGGRGPRRAGRGGVGALPARQARPD